MHLPSPSGKAVSNTRSIFTWNSTGMYSDLSFSLSGCHTKIIEPSLPVYKTAVSLVILNYLSSSLTLSLFLSFSLSYSFFLYKNMGVYVYVYKPNIVEKRGSVTPSIRLRFIYMIPKEADPLYLAFTDRICCVLNDFKFSLPH